MLKKQWNITHFLGLENLIISRGNILEMPKSLFWKKILPSKLFFVNFLSSHFGATAMFSSVVLA